MHHDAFRRFLQPCFSHISPENLHATSIHCLGNVKGITLSGLRMLLLVCGAAWNVYLFLKGRSANEFAPVARGLEQSPE
jgi:hypothetical protein